MLEIARAPAATVRPAERSRDAIERDRASGKFSDAYLAKHYRT